MSFRTTAPILLSGLIAAFAAMAFIAGCSQGSSGSGSAVYQDPPELTATYDSLEALAGNTGATLTFEDYQAVYQHFLEQYPNSTELHRDYQSTMDAFGMTDQKLAQYKEMHEQNPESAMFAYLYGRCLPAGEDAELFRKSVELDPEYFWGHFGFAVVSLRNNPVDTAAAVEHLEKSLEIDDTYPAAYSQLIGIHDSRGELKLALEYAETYAQTSPESYRPIQMQTDLLSRLDRAEDAEALMLEFAEQNEKNSGVRADLVEHYKAKEDFPAALKWQHEYAAIARDPDAALVDVAKIHLALDQADSALHYLNQAAGRGYADFRRVSQNAELAGIQGAEGYDDLMTVLKENAEAAREQRLAKFLENAEENRVEALEGQLDEPAPEFSFKNLDGETVALADLRGKVVVIDFWATWCGPCRMTMPVLQEFVDRAAENVVFLSLNVWEDDQSKVKPYIEDYGYSFNVLFGDNQVASDYSVSGIPTMVVIDPEGVLQYKHVGYDPHLDQILLWQTEHLLKKASGTQAKL